MNLTGNHAQGTHLVVDRTNIKTTNEERALIANATFGNKSVAQISRTFRDVGATRLPLQVSAATIYSIFHGNRVYVSGAEELHEGRASRKQCKGQVGIVC